MKKSMFLLATAAAFQTSAATAATLSEANFRVDYVYDDGTTNGLAMYTNTNGPIFGTVGPGPDASIRVEERTDIQFDFDDRSLDLIINTSLADPVWDSITFNGIRITFLDLAADIESFSLVSSSFGPITQIYSATEIFMSWPGAAYPNGSTASFSVELTDAVAPVPLPAGAPLLLAALAALGVMRRRRTAEVS